ncbi:hypothetical protein AGMMS49938_14190 [Fibrobacterales bacterium]|nr:hypothetical protein AGMMS49938_14190 [Fibrobacterales bacterium]
MKKSLSLLSVAAVAAFFSACSSESGNNNDDSSSGSSSSAYVPPVVETDSVEIRNFTVELNSYLVTISGSVRTLPTDTSLKKLDSVQIASDFAINYKKFTPADSIKNYTIKDAGGDDIAIDIRNESISCGEHNVCVNAWVRGKKNAAASECKKFTKPADVYCVVSSSSVASSSSVESRSITKISGIDQAKIIASDFTGGVLKGIKLSAGEAIATYTDADIYTYGNGLSLKTNGGYKIYEYFDITSCVNAEDYTQGAIKSSGVGCVIANPSKTGDFIFTGSGDDDLDVSKSSYYFVAAPGYAEGQWTKWYLILVEVDDKQATEHSVLITAWKVQ